jgi:prepilin-type processing-associated H-X9-DG protein
VVCAIIAVLIAILLPLLGVARSRSKRVACAAQLREVGSFFQMYLNDSRGRIPRVNPLPSVQPPVNEFISIYRTLEPYTKTARHVWHCPADRITEATSGAPDGFESYFDREGGSYVYHEFLNAFAVDLTRGLINRMFREAIELHQSRTGRGPERMIVFHEFEAFHGKPQTPNAMNYLFADFHVGDLEGGGSKTIVIQQ